MCCWVAGSRPLLHIPHCVQLRPAVQRPFTTAPDTPDVQSRTYLGGRIRIYSPRHYMCLRQAAGYRTGGHCKKSAASGCCNKQGCASLGSDEPRTRFTLPLLPLMHINYSISISGHPSALCTEPAALHNATSTAAALHPMTTTSLGTCWYTRVITAAVQCPVHKRSFSCHCSASVSGSNMLKRPGCWWKSISGRCGNPLGMMSPGWMAGPGNTGPFSSWNSLRLSAATETHKTTPSADTGCRQHLCDACLLAEVMMAQILAQAT